MGAIKSKNKYVLLFGDSGSGKTLTLYSMQSSLNINENLLPTEGFNYEEIKVKDTALGIFDISGDMKQYEIANIVTKCVNISGIIFVIPLDKIEQIDKSKELLKLMLANNFLRPKISLLVIYNMKNSLAEKFLWMNESLLNSRIDLDRIKETYNISYIYSCITDIGVNYYSERSAYHDALEEFVDHLDREK